MVGVGEVDGGGQEGQYQVGTCKEQGFGLGNFVGDCQTDGWGMSY